MVRYSLVDQKSALGVEVVDVEVEKVVFVVVEIVVVVVVVEVVVVVDVRVVESAVVLKGIKKDRVSGFSVVESSNKVVDCHSIVFVLGEKGTGVVRYSFGIPTKYGLYLERLGLVGFGLRKPPGLLLLFGRFKYLPANL